VNRRATLLAALAVLGLAAGDAGAGPGAVGPRYTVAILSINTSSDDVARSYEAELESQLATMRVRFVPRARLREELGRSTKWTDGCVVGGCLTEVRAHTGAGIVLLAALTGSGTTFGYVVTLVRTDNGRVLAQEAERCDVCTESEATGNALLTTIKLVNAIPNQLPDEAAEQDAAVDVAVNEASRRRTADRRRTRRVGLALTLVGLAATGAGAFIYLGRDDRPHLGLALGAGGGGLAIGGLTVLAF
jgi:hypothetical protein